MPLNIIEYAGKKYYQVKPHERIRRYALHSLHPTASFSPIKYEHTIGKTPSVFTNGRYFFNPLIESPKRDNKPQKFDINNLYNSKEKK